MPVLRNLNEDEQRILLHKIRNAPRKGNDLISESLLDQMSFQRVEKLLAQLSEDENYNAKNRYRLQKTTLDYAEKKRMPIDEAKLKDVLRNRGQFKHKMNEEIGTYNGEQHSFQLESGILTYMTDAAYGEMSEFVKDLGIQAENLEFLNVGDL
jgi:hypothetical protein